MIGGSRRRAIRLYDRSEELLRELSAPSDPMAAVVTDLVGEYEADAGEVLTEEARSVLRVTFLRGYALRLAADEPIAVAVPDDPHGDPGASVRRLMELGHDDRWFFTHAFPYGDRVWFRLAVPFHSLTVAMLQEPDPDAAIWPWEVIDAVLRAGYLGADVDERLQLRAR